MPTNAQTRALSEFSISATLPAATEDQTAWEAVTGWAVIGEVTTSTGHGDTFAEVTHSPLSSRRIQKLKGTVNAGTETLTLADDIDDAGQVIAKTALASDADFSFKEVWQDGTVEYFYGKVMSFSGTGGDNDTIRARTMDVGINSAILEVAPTP